MCSCVKWFEKFIILYIVFIFYILEFGISFKSSVLECVLEYVFIVYKNKIVVLILYFSRDDKMNIIYYIVSFKFVFI